MLKRLLIGLVTFSAIASATAVADNQAKIDSTVEKLESQKGIDIGGTMIGMHLKYVAVPLRISLRKIGEAPILCARVRPKYVGGARAVYDENLM